MELNLTFKSKLVDDDDRIEIHPSLKVIEYILFNNITDVVLKDEDGNEYIGEVLDGNEEPSWGRPYLWIEFK